jgi:predicted metal-dependent hydrolase
VGTALPARNRDNDWMRLDWSSGALAEGLRCYRAEEFFLAHEHWEGVWLEAQEPEKTFLQALIQTAAAFHHLQRGNRIGAASLLRAALRRMEPHEISFGGVRVEMLRGELEAWVTALEVEGGEIRLAVPDIPLEDPSGERE